MTQLEKAIEKELEYINENEMTIPAEDMHFARFLAEYFAEWGAEHFREATKKVEED